jgi:hypothetical protein
LPDKELHAEKCDGAADQCSRNPPADTDEGGWLRQIATSHSNDFDGGRSLMLSIAQKAWRCISVIASSAVLLAPAIWNRFPLLQYDTGGYFVRWYEGYLMPSRSTVFGLFLDILAHPDFWPALLVQTALTVWILVLVLRVFDLDEHPLMLPGVASALAILTTLPWLTSILLTDIFAGLAVLATYLLVFADDALGRWERNGLFVLIAFAAATHNATFAVLLALLAAAALARRYFGMGSAGGIFRGVAAMAMGAAILVGSNYLVARQLSWTPGGLALSFGRMLQDGMVDRYLADHCPSPRLKLCAHRRELPTRADVFFWGNDLFDELGSFDGLGDEMNEIVLGSLRDYPGWHAEAAVIAGARQLFRFGTGEGVVNEIWHTYWGIEKFAPSTAGDMRAARQQRGELDFVAINRIHEPVALASMLLLLVTIQLGWRREAFSGLVQLSATVVVALLANAMVCGVLSNPHDRYGARLIWIAPLVVILLLCRARSWLGTAAKVQRHSA